MSFITAHRPTDPAAAGECQRLDDQELADCCASTPGECALAISQLMQYAPQTVPAAEEDGTDSG